MNHAELKHAREALGLTVEEAGDILECGTDTVKRMEMPPGKKTRREPPARVVRLYKAYLEGYRPDDWPERLIRKEGIMERLEEVRPQ